MHERGTFMQIRKGMEAKGLGNKGTGLEGKGKTDGRTSNSSIGAIVTNFSVFNSVYRV